MCMLGECDGESNIFTERQLHVVHAPNVLSVSFLCYTDCYCAR